MSDRIGTKVIDHVRIGGRAARHVDAVRGLVILLRRGPYRPIGLMGHSEVPSNLLRNRERTAVGRILGVIRGRRKFLLLRGS